MLSDQNVHYGFLIFSMYDYFVSPIESQKGCLPIVNIVKMMIPSDQISTD